MKTESIRNEVRELLASGPFSGSARVNLDTIRRQEELLDAIKSPITDDEAKELVKLFGPDDYFGLAWTLLHLIETAPSWPIADCLRDDSNEWVVRLKERARRGRN